MFCDVCTLSWSKCPTFTWKLEVGTSRSCHSWTHLNKTGPPNWTSQPLCVKETLKFHSFQFRRARDIPSVHVATPPRFHPLIFRSPLTWPPTFPHFLSLSFTFSLGHDQSSVRFRFLRSVPVIFGSEFEHSMATRNRTLIFRRYRDALKSVRVPSSYAAAAPSMSSSGGPVIELVNASLLNPNRSYAPLSTEDPGNSRSLSLSLSPPFGYWEIVSKVKKFEFSI